MAMSPTGWAGGAGIALGAGAVVVLLVVAAPGRPTVPPRASVALAMNRTPTLGVQPVGIVLGPVELDGRSAPTARVRLTNQADRCAELRVRVSPPNSEAGEALVLELRATGRRLFQRPLWALRSWTRTRVQLLPGSGVELTIRVALSGTEPPGTELAAGTLTLETLEQPCVR